MIRKDKTKIDIIVTTKEGNTSTRLFRIGSFVWCHLRLNFSDEDAAKGFTKRVGVDCNTLIAVLEKRERGHFIEASKKNGREKIWEEEIK